MSTMGKQLKSAKAASTTESASPTSISIKNKDDNEPLSDITNLSIRSGDLVSSTEKADLVKSGTSNTEQALSDEITYADAGKTCQSTMVSTESIFPANLTAGSEPAVAVIEVPSGPLLGRAHHQKDSLAL